MSTAEYLTHDPCRIKVEFSNGEVVYDGLAELVHKTVDGVDTMIIRKVQTCRSLLKRPEPGAYLRCERPADHIENDVPHRRGTITWGVNGAAGKIQLNGETP